MTNYISYAIQATLIHTITARVLVNYLQSIQVLFRRHASTCRVLDPRSRR